MDQPSNNERPESSVETQQPEQHTTTTPDSDETKTSLDSIENNKSDDTNAIVVDQDTKMPPNTEKKDDVFPTEVSQSSTKFAKHVLPPLPAERLSGLDTFFCVIERPENLMNIAGLWEFRSAPDVDLVKEELQLMVERFPRFRQRIVRKPFGSIWFEDYDFNLDDHLVIEDLPKDCDQETYRLEISRIASLPLDESKALWQGHMLNGFTREDGSIGYALLIRLHHCITDGQGSIRAILSLTSLKGEMGVPMQYGGHAPPSGGSAQSKTRKPVLPFRLIQTLFQTLVMLPYYFIYLIYMILSLVRVTLYERKSLNLVKPADTKKEVAWSKEISLDDVKLVKNVLGGTVNDVLVTALHSAICDVLTSTGNKNIDSELLYAIPVSLRHPSDWSLTNKAATAYLFLPTKTSSNTITNLSICKSRLDKVKKSLEPLIGYWLYSGILRYPWLISRGLVDWYLKKIHAVLTNVPGPLHPISFAGQEIVSYKPIIPQPGPGGLGLGILSYAGKVVVSVHTQAESHSGNAHLPGGPKALVNAFNTHFDTMLSLAKEKSESSKQSTNNNTNKTKSE
eukprot:TRINITY_DN12889_c0_g1_i1.p1 TRINITY_DN12889_c0_g1~~TRINITY_DN12889_c0_g1_i1.p1  ORF type:complete len:566 (-),score=106.80 TRINITY_DN12889_c0_g1_i1:37-1734(-)